MGTYGLLPVVTCSIADQSTSDSQTPSANMADQWCHHGEQWMWLRLHHTKNLG